MMQQLRTLAKSVKNKIFGQDTDNYDPYGGVGEAETIKLRKSFADSPAVERKRESPNATRVIPCTCSPSMWDGDDGWDRECPEHGAGIEY